MREWLERECQKSLGPPKRLASTYVKDLLEEEELLQREELEIPEHISVIFDATPRGGDFFALLARRIVIDEKARKAEARQSLIHASALKGSLNADTLVGELTKALGNRGMSHKKAVAAMNDGCFTNGACHDILEKAAEISDDMSRLVSLCISHCCSNAGKQAGFPLLDLFWSYIQKVMSHSDAAKVRMVL